MSYGKCNWLHNKIILACCLAATSISPTPHTYMYMYVHIQSPQPPPGTFQVGTNWPVYSYLQVYTWQKPFKYVNIWKSMWDKLLTAISQNIYVISTELIAVWNSKQNKI